MPVLTRFLPLNVSRRFRFHPTLSRYGRGMEEQNRSAITARHPHHELAQDRHAKAPAIATRRSVDPGVEPATCPNWSRFKYPDSTKPGQGHSDERGPVQVDQGSMTKVDLPQLVADLAASAIRLADQL